MKKRSNDLCILAMSFREVDNEMKIWEEKRNKKGNIYKAFADYILCLEKSLETEEDSYKRYLIEQEIKKLKKEQKKYYVPSILEMAVYNGRKDKQEKDNLEKSSFNLVKRFIKK